jgi:hypothetical protein
MSQEVVIRHNLPALPGDDLDTRAKKALDDVARGIGRSAVNHLKTMYPDALAGVTANAERSLTNHVRNEINWRMKPLLELLVAQMRDGKL